MESKLKMGSEVRLLVTISRFVHRHCNIRGFQSSMKLVSRQLLLLKKENISSENYVNLAISNSGLKLRLRLIVSPACNDKKAITF